MNFSWHVSIGDFGGARVLMDSKLYYKKQSNDAVPIKWMSPEAIRDKIYTNKSDVWSFGVLMWEVLSFGASPYGGWTAPTVIQSVRNGFRLPCPESCPQEL